MPAGYSGTPLVKKLGIKEGFRVALVGAPDGFRAELEELPNSVSFVTSVQAQLDFVLFFATTRSELMRNFSRLAAKLAPTGMLWIAWPKKASGVATDLADYHVRQIGLDAGLVDVKVCAVNEIWSGLKFVIRCKGPAQGFKLKEYGHVRASARSRSPASGDRDGFIHLPRLDASREDSNW